VNVLWRRTSEERLLDDDGRPNALGSRLLGPLHAGTLRVVNAFGTGVADDKRIYPYVEELVRFYTGDEPLVPSVRSYDLADEGQRAAAFERLDELVVKPRTGSGGFGVVVGPRAAPDQLRAARDAIAAQPGAYIAQETVSISTHPTLVGGRLAPRHLDLRPFVFHDGRVVQVLPGGLSRFALEEGDLVVNSSQGGGGKDVRVLPDAAD
jgi:carboxylate-amine ligase